jgi:deoxycytidine triphosphate deaminase
MESEEEMTILADHQIRELVEEYAMIDPFVETLTEKGVISYGLSSTGYDCRVGNKGRIFTNLRTAIVDPKAITNDSFFDVEVDEYFIIPPNSYMLAATIEYFRLPRWVLHSFNFRFMRRRHWITRSAKASIRVKRALHYRKLKENKLWHSTTLFAVNSRP